MKSFYQALVSIICALVCNTTAHAALSYWDLDGANPGAGSTAGVATGTWDGINTFWSTDSTGSSATSLWTPGDTAVFAAGTDATLGYTVTLSGVQTLAGVTVEEGTVLLTGGGLLMDVAGGGTIDIGSGTTTFTSAISGGLNNQTITKNGNGQLNLNIASTYTGLTTVNAGTVLLGNQTALGTIAGATTVNAGGAVLINTSTTGATGVAEPITLNGTGVGGAGALRSTGSARFWTGGITLGSSGVKIASDSGTLTINSSISSGGNNYDLTLAGSGNIRLNTSGGVNIGTGTLTKDGTGAIQTEVSMTFGAVNFVDGVINFRLGVAGFGGGSAVITAGPNADAISTVAGFTSATAGNSIVLNHPSLSIGTTVNNTTLTLGGVISGVSGGINAVSSATGGKLVLNNAETYGGETKVTTGTLQLGAAGSIANSSGVNVVGGTFDVSLVSFTLGASQTLKGAGTVSGAVAVNGTLAPGNSAAGILTFNNTLTLNSTAQLAYELAGGNTTPGGSVNDLVTGVSNLTLDGTLNVTEIGAGSFLAAVGGNKWRLFTYAGTLTDNTLVLGTMPALADPSYSFAIDTSTSGQVNLSVVPEPSVLWLLSASAGLVLGGRSWLRRRA